MNRLIFIFFLLLSTNSFGQWKNYQKANQLYSNKKWAASNKLLDKCIVHPETKNNMNVLLLKSKVLYEISFDKKLKEKFPKAIKEAIKYAEKAYESAPNQSKADFKKSNYQYFKQLTAENNKDALEAFHTKRYGKALPLFKSNLNLVLDTQSLVYAGICLWEIGQKTESIQYFKTSAEYIYNSVMDSTSKYVGFSKEPFRRLGDYYIQRKHFDTAYIYVKKGRDLNPSDAVLTEMTYLLTKYRLDKILPSIDYLYAVQDGLKDFPTDSFLNHKENAIYIYLLNGMAKANEQNQFDSLLSHFCKSKEIKKNNSKITLIQRFDIFAGKDKKSIVTQLFHYFGEIYLYEACYATFNSVLFNKTSDNISHPLLLNPQKPLFAEMIFRRQLELDPKNTLAKAGLTKYTQLYNSKALSYYDLDPMIKLNLDCAKENPKDLNYKSKLKEIRLRLIDEASDSGDFRLARRVWQETSTFHPETKLILEKSWEKLVINDFKFNYFGTRINNKGKKENNVEEFNWNGSVDSCRAGIMSNKLVNLVERRINYFRRNAGLSEEVRLTLQDNLYCEIAAMMCEANKTMSHEPNDGWRCYIPAGAQVLKDALLIKEGNPAIAITAAMGHNHPSIGNRRWLLYPKAMYMGLGSSKSYTVIKAIDQARELDSLKYKKQYIVWPPETIAPKMLAFKKWSFSIQQNLSDATVTMKTNTGESITVVQEKPENGYGINTLVWEPKLNEIQWNNETIFNITIQLKNGKNYSYKTRLLDIQP
jgi:tetratricopeptide (TPR) repeat protein